MYQNEFWDWSLQAYAKPATQSACLHLQDTFAQDVNMMLWGCWLGSQGLSPTAKAIDTLPVIRENWQSSLIAGVRKARKQIGTVSHLETAKSLKAAFLALEISLERQEQTTLQALLTINGESTLTPPALCLQNLHSIATALPQSANTAKLDLEEALQSLITSIL